MIWFDFDNAPHILFWSGIIGDLQKRKHNTLISARDFSYTKKMLDRTGLKYYLCKTGRTGKRAFYKYLNVFERSYELHKIIAGLPIKLSLGHGSRSQILTSYFNRIPYLSATDYEHADMKHVALTTYTCVPEVIPKRCFGLWSRKIIHYSGFKEDMYLFNYHPEPIPEQELPIQRDKVVILFRPGDYYSHYQTGLYGQIENEMMNFFKKHKQIVYIILMPRHPEQQKKLEDFLNSNQIPFVVPQRSYLVLILFGLATWLLGGGGTMLREACALNIPAYSFFSGKTGHIDQYFSDHGQMVFVRDKGHVRKIRLEKCEEKKVRRNPAVFNFFKNLIYSYL